MKYYCVKKCCVTRSPSQYNKAKQNNQPENKNNERRTDWKGRKKTISSYR